MKLGFIGLGRMGSAMATNLLKAGHEVTVFNRSPQKLRPLVELGAREVTAAHPGPSSTPPGRLQGNGHHAVKAWRDSPFGCV